MAFVFGFTCRAATLADKDAVFAINKEVHNGFDYLPDTYEDTINDPNFYCYLIEKDDEIIGFAGHRVLVNDKATVAGMMRLREEHQGKGLIKTLDQYILKKVRQDHPSIETYRYVTSYASRVKKRIEDPTSGYRLIAHMMYHCLDTTASKVKEKVSASRKLENRNVRPVKEILKSQYAKLHLNIGKVILYNSIWTPVASEWENIASIAEKSPAYVTLGEENICHAVSFSHLYISSRGYVVNLHFSSLDGATFDRHFQRHLKEVIRLIPSEEARIFIRVLGPRDLESVKPLLTEYGEIAEEFEVFACESTLQANDRIEPQ